MMGGVAFFSFIMGKFMEIITNYQIKMGNEDKTKELMKWLTGLQKFTQGTSPAGMPLRLSLLNSIIDNMNYYWSNDRLAWTRDEMFFPLPYKLKQDVVVYYLNKDIFEKNLRFFRSDSKMTTTLRGWTPYNNVAQKKDDLMEPSFLYHFSCGLQPRMFDSKDNLDKIIFEEEAEVSEMYFFQKGQIGVEII